MLKPAYARGQGEVVGMPVDVAQGFKFAVMALPAARGSAPPQMLDLSGGFFASHGLPQNALTTWLDGIGTFHRDELAQCSFFLWSVAQSSTPEVLDQENQQLERLVHYLLLGTLLAIPYFSFGRVTRLTGANSDGTARVRSLTTFSRTYWTLGAPQPAVSASKLRLAAKLATALVKHDTTRSRDRFDRSLRAFRVACESSYLDERHHEFVRAAEGFVVPANATEFTKRLSMLCAGRCQQHLRHIYRIRSGIEHLHGMYDRMPKGATKRERFQLALMRCVEAEALARYLIVTYLQHPDLWDHFRSRASISRFWALKRSRRTALWPTRLHFPSILKSFDGVAVRKSESKYLR